MFTVETEFDHSKITVMDETNQVPDFIGMFADEGIYLTQWDENANEERTLYLTTKMFNDMMLAFNSTDGTFISS
jgi:hypothetical protein